MDSLASFHSDRSYLVGSLRRTSMACVVSLMSSLPRMRRDALVHLALRGFFFFLNSLLHFERQNLKT